MVELISLAAHKALGRTATSPDFRAPVVRPLRLQRACLLNRALVDDAKKSVALVAGRGINAKDRSNWGRWLPP